MTFINSLFAGYDVSELMKQLHEDERGDNENLGRLLILALILIPLIILIALFGDTIAKEAKTQWDKVMKSGVKQP